MASGGEQNAGGGGSRRRLRAPRGTRDLYPEDVLRRRYLTGVWRDTAIRHGFEEIDGPTFELSELYAVKSGEGILGELFQAYSGKSPEEVERVQKEGVAPFALRPEFTPTGARMYAARAAQLGRPVRWFNIGPRYRAERPQRGRLREFLQFDCDVIGDDGTPEGRAAADGSCVDVAVSALGSLGLSSGDAVARYASREGLEHVLEAKLGLGPEERQAAMVLLDRRGKMSQEAFDLACAELSINAAGIDDALGEIAHLAEGPGAAGSRSAGPGEETQSRFDFGPLRAQFEIRGISGCTALDASIVRGLAYYTGTVFEVIAEGERAVAGGGRYDNLVELLGGPATPAVGFAMGDVVLSLLLEDKGLMPEGRELMEAVSRPPASVRPDLFVVSGAAKDEDGSDLDRLVTRLVADARRGVASGAYEHGEARPWSAERYTVPPLHARTSDKATRNLKKLLNDAERQHARFAAIVHEPGKVQLKDLDRREEIELDLSVDPRSDAYVGREVATRLGRTG